MPAKMAFVTGGTGFIGLNLIELLTASGWDVIALRRPTSKLSQLEKYPVRLVEGQIEDANSLRRVMPEDLDAVFHVAGDTSMWASHKNRQWRTNVEGTRNMVMVALAKRSKKFVHTSTSGVYGFPANIFDETAPKLGKGNFNYQHSKAAAEEEVLNAVGQGLDAVILNPANVVGRYDWNSWSRFIQRAANRQLLLIPPGSACFCDVDAVARAHVMAVHAGRTGENYLLGGPQASYREIVEVTGTLLGRPIDRRTGNALGLRFVAEALGRLSVLTRREPIITPETAAFLSANIRCRSDKAMRELDYQPQPLEVMLKSCIDWMRAENLLGRAA
jgi:dihydroflavonol-4-reductase